MKYVLRRSAQALLVIAGVIVMTFLLLHIIPGDPARQILGNHATASQVAQLRQKWGLNRPLTVQFGSFVARVFAHADTGNSLFYNVPTRSLILPRTGVTLELVVMAGIFCVLITVPLAVFAAIRRDRLPDHLIRIIPAIGAGMPALWLGLMLIIVFSVRLHWFPVGGAGPGVWLTFRGLVLPWITLALVSAATYTRLTRGSMLDVLGEDYIRTARAKGMPERRVIFRHALRAALTPVVTQYGIDVGVLLGGAVITEYVFGMPGLGFTAVQAIQQQDLPVVIGVVIVAAAAVVVANIVVDALYAVLDPRVRLH